MTPISLIKSFKTKKTIESYKHKENVSIMG